MSTAYSLMNGRNIDRVTAFAAVGLLAALAIGTFYIAEVASRNYKQAIKAPATEPDFYVTGFTLLKLNQQGEPAFRITAKRMTHYPDRDTSEFEEPVAVSLRPGRAPITVSALKAISRDINTEQASSLVLINQVKLVRKDEPDRPGLLIESESITINPDDETAYGSLPVKMTSGVSTMTAVGFSYDHPQQKLNLQSEVKGVWNSTKK